MDTSNRAASGGLSHMQNTNQEGSSSVTRMFDTLLNMVLIGDTHVPSQNIAERHDQVVAPYSFLDLPHRSNESNHQGPDALWYL